MRLWQIIESAGNSNMIHIGPPDDYMDDVWKHEVYINSKMVTSGEHFELDGKRFDSVDQFIVALSKKYNVPAEFDLYMLDDDGENPTLSSPGFTPRSSMTMEQFDEAAGEKDACYHKVKSRYKVWPSAYASGALVKCRKVGAKNWGNSKKK